MKLLLENYDRSRKFVRKLDYIRISLYYITGVLGSNALPIPVAFVKKFELDPEKGKVYIQIYDNELFNNIVEKFLAQIKGE